MGGRGQPPVLLRGLCCRDRSVPSVLRDRAPHVEYKQRCLAGMADRSVLSGSEGVISRQRVRDPVLTMRADRLPAALPPNRMMDGTLGGLS